MERPLVFGTHNNLVGVVHVPNPAGHAGVPEGLPETASVDCQSFGVVMLTPGMLHSAGPFRLHVALAESLGQQGIPSLRFDLSGIGESLGIGARGNSIERATEEARQAMDALQKECGVGKFVLFGLCSGADDSLYVAHADDRVVGAVLLDGLGFRTPRFYLHRLLQHYLPKMSSWRRWKKLASRIVRSTAAPSNSMIGGDDIREFPDREKAQQLLQSLITRQVRLMMVYTGGAGSYFNYQRQFDDMFPHLNTKGFVQLKCLPHADHVAYMCEDRQYIVQHCSEWIARCRTVVPTVHILSGAVGQ